MARINALIDRWGTVAVTFIGALVLLVGLGTTGLWEPWEMDRADLARTLAEPPQVAVALSHEASDLRDTVDGAARRVGVVPHHAGDGQRRPSRAQALRGALDYARTHIVAAVLLDARLLLPDPDKASDWSAAATKVNEALSYVPNGEVLIVESRDGVTLEELRARLAVERLRAAWERVAVDYELSELAAASDLDRAIEATAAERGDDPRLNILVKPDAPALADALDDAARASGVIVSFKDRGDTIAVPPLDTWLRTASYRALGATELSTRLPGALLSLLTLWVLMLVAAAVWSPRVATLAGLVLVSTPLFYAQARSAAGEPSAILALTLVAGGLLLRERRATSAMLWAYLSIGFGLAFLSKGLFGATVVTALALAMPLVTGSLKARRWMPGLIMAAATALLALWVFSSPSQGFAGQFRFTQPIFSEGPTRHARNFDFMIRQLGFGLFPWSPLAVVALGGLIFEAVRQRSRTSLVVALWFLLPLTAWMFGLKDLHQLIWPAVPAAALATALLLEQLMGRGARGYLIALALALMFAVLAHELGKSPEPLVSFITTDPPFAKKGSLRFPETLTLSRTLAIFVFLAALAAVAYFGRLVAFARDALIFFRRPRPFAIALGTIFTLMPTIWLIRIGDAHRVAAGRAHTDLLGDSQRNFIMDFVSVHEPAFLIAVLTAIALVTAVVFTWIFPRVGAWTARHLGSLVRPGPRFFYISGAILWGIPALILSFSVVFPSDYWAETFLGLPTLAAYAAAAALGWLVWRASEGDRVQVIAIVAALLALFIVSRLSRDAGWRASWVTATIFVGWLLLALGALPQLLVGPERFALGAGAVMGLVLMGVVVPLLDRYGWIERVLYPADGAYMTRRLLVFSKVSILYLVAIGLVINYRLHDRLAPLARRLLRVDRGPVVVGATIFAALVVTVGSIGGLHAALAENVSEKHVIDAYLESEADAGPGAAGRIFKHGSFAAQDRKDANFYTAAIPELRDRHTALEVLLGATDQVAIVESPSGTETRVLPGWSAANDVNRDGVRDLMAIQGFATKIGPSTLTDAAARWTPGALVGRVLVDSNGHTWEIASNDAQTLTVKGGARLTFSTTSQARAFYVIDSAEMADHRATAERRERRALLIPAGSLSEINHAFRKLAGGRHLPILDGRSYRVLLATGWLEEGEEQSNRIANAVYTQAQFDALTDPRVKRVWGDFEDLIRVVGYRLDKPVATKGEGYKITIYYKALKSIRRSYKIFMHLDLEGGGERIHGDHWPLNPTKHSEHNKSCTGCFRTDHWLPGDIVAETYELDIPSTVPSGDYFIWVGFYEPGRDNRLKVKAFEKGKARHTGDNRLGVGTFQVR